MAYSLPSAITGADLPGKSAAHSVSFAETFSGRPDSRDTPHCSGPRQLNHPRHPVSEACIAKAAKTNAAVRQVHVDTDRPEESLRLAFPSWRNGNQIITGTIETGNFR